MGRRNKKGRSITGIIIIDKPTGRSSNHVLQQVRRLFDAKKAGHTGNLDPLATGVLPICLGEATKVSSYLLDSDKQYQVTCQLGAVTDTGDSEGKIISSSPISTFSEQDLLGLIPQFIGEQEQVPPMFSALKHQGQPLYKLARQGIDVERKARKITIYDIKLLSIDNEKGCFSLDVRCSKGTYIRTLVEDISHALGSGGHVIVLRRTKAAGYSLENAVRLEQLEQAAEQGLGALDPLLSKTEEALPEWPKIQVSKEDAAALRHGQTIQISSAFERENICLFDEQYDFIGLGKMSEQGIVAPKRIFVESDD